MVILVNMFMQKVKPRGRGRPPGRTAEGAAAKRRLYDAAIGLMAARGYESTTLRDVADEAGVSVGLLYRYFPSKRAVIVELYEELSAEYVRQVAAMPRGRWRDRFLFAVTTSLEVLEPHRSALKGLIPVIVGDPEEGVFAEGMAFSRRRVQSAFESAVSGATDSPGAPLAEALGRLPLPRASGRAALVVAGQEPASTRDGSARHPEPTDPPVGCAHPQASARSEIPPRPRRPVPRSAVR